MVSEVTSGFLDSSSLTERAGRAACFVRSVGTFLACALIEHACGSGCGDGEGEKSVRF